MNAELASTGDTAATLAEVADRLGLKLPRCLELLRSLASAAPAEDALLLDRAPKPAAGEELVLGRGGDAEDEDDSWKGEEEEVEEEGTPPSASAASFTSGSKLSAWD